MSAGERMNTDYICDGRCCERFFFPKTIEEMEVLKEALQSGSKIEELTPNYATIIDMVIPIEPHENPDSEGNVGAWYTCSHWDTETRKCQIYETRPLMCRGYPYGKECTSCGSTCGTSENWFEEATNIKPRPSGGISFDEVSGRVK